MNQTSVLEVADGSPATSDDVAFEQFGAGDTTGPAFMTFAAEPLDVLKTGRRDVHSLPISDGSRFVSKEHYPQFTWDRIPLYMHIRKAKSYTDDEIAFLAKFPLITFEKANGHQDHGSVEAGTLCTIDHHHRTLERLDPLGQLGCRDIGSAEIELGDTSSECSMSDQHQPERLLALAYNRFDDLLELLAIILERPVGRGLQPDLPDRCTGIACHLDPLIGPAAELLAELVQTCSPHDKNDAAGIAGGIGGAGGCRLRILPDRHAGQAGRNDERQSREM